MIVCVMCDNEQGSGNYCMNCGTHIPQKRSSNKPPLAMNKFVEEFRKELYEKVDAVVDRLGRDGDKNLVDFRVEKYKNETVDGSPGHFVRISFHSNNPWLVTIYRG